MSSHIRPLFDNRKPRSQVEIMQIDFGKAVVITNARCAGGQRDLFVRISSATISYFLVDLSHVAIGIVLTILLIFISRVCSATNPCWPVWDGSCLPLERSSESCSSKSVRHFGLSLGCTRTLLCAFLARLFLAISWLFSKGWLGDGVIRRGLGFAAMTLVTVGIAAGTWWTRESLGKTQSHLQSA